MTLKPALVVALTCSTGIAAVCIYRYAIPGTWEEILTKEGYLFLSTDEEYKAVLSDNKTDIQELREATEAEVHYPKVRIWCEAQLKSYPNKSYDEAKSNVINLCTQKGIKTVKGLLLYSKQRGFLKTEGTADDNKYKVLFAVYRYNEEFLSWLNVGKTTDTLTIQSKASEKFEALKNKCKMILNAPKESVTNIQDYKYASWWCTPINGVTVEERIKLKNPDWEKETEASKIKGIWEHTQDVKNKVKERNKNDTDVEPKSTEYKEWCDEGLKKNLYDDDIYKDEYEMLMSVCKKTD